MKTKILLSSLMSLLFATSFAQDRTTVNATSSEISDNLDLRAVASIFGDSKDLADFEFRLNDPKAQISNLDLNNDNQVDYLRVIESVEGRTHLIVIQSVLGNNQFQDVATVEVEKDKNNRVQVQVVGDVYMYGNNYIYEPVYVHVPVIYDYFWVSNYRPYYSTWNWGYYPTYYYAWNPFPIFRYRHHIGLCINFNYQYNYVNYRRCQTVYNDYYGKRGNYYERQYPARSFERRNSGFSNRYDLDQTRPRRDVAFNDSPRNTSSNPRGNSNDSPRNFDNPRANSTGSPRNVNSPRSNSNDSPRNANSNPRSNEPRSVVNENPRVNANDSPRNANSNTRSNEPIRTTNTNPRENSNDSPRNTSSNPRSSEPRSVENENPRGNNNQPPRSYESPRQSNTQSSSSRNSGYSTSRSSEPRSMGGSQRSGNSGGEVRSSGRR